MAVKVRARFAARPFRRAAFFLRAEKRPQGPAGVTGHA